MTNRSHYSGPISTDPTHIGGYSRQAGEASNETKIAVIDAIENIAAQYDLSQRDIANLIAIANLESKFNPDAATRSQISSASGVMQVTDYWAGEILRKYDGTARINGHKLGKYDRFDLNSNIEYGIALYLDAKAIAKSNDVGDIYKKYNGDPSQYTKHLENLRKESEKYLKDLQNGATSEKLLSEYPSGGPKTRLTTPTDTDGNGIPDWMKWIKDKFTKPNNYPPRSSSTSTATASPPPLSPMAPTSTTTPTASPKPPAGSTRKTEYWCATSTATGLSGC